MERSEERRWRMEVPASVTRKIFLNSVETRIVVFAIVTKVGPGMPHTVDTSPVV